MKRRFNYTGRKTIPTHLVRAVVHPPGADGLRSFDMSLGNLAELGLPADARVYVEAYVKSSSMRFPFGTVGAVLPPSDRRLPDLDEGAGVLFRVLVVDEKDAIGRLLALADQVPPAAEEADRQSLLPIQLVDLDQEIWRLEVDPSSPPRLLLNNRFPGLKQRFLSEPLLMGAVLPVAVRDALRTMAGQDDGEREWIGKWRRYVHELAGEETATSIFEPDDDDAVEEAISHVCDLFVRRRQYMARALDIAGNAADA
ncbi:hypothetical protein MHL39_13530 [Roseomonas mucosa]|uniref:hypothetical protein n=1 Tax=Roseomonas mucosa TaxID=207340 RepID=UPI001EF659F9|nr:hypothetical protein [Roseomonas mucosa]MCG7357657.1 hypothetical protein [Roseomonas mucosa]